jgi:hypothetical protein
MDGDLLLVLTRGEDRSRAAVHQRAGHELAASVSSPAGGGPGRVACRPGRRARPRVCQQRRVNSRPPPGQDGPIVASRSRTSWSARGPGRRRRGDPFGQTTAPLPTTASISSGVPALGERTPAGESSDGAFAASGRIVLLVDQPASASTIRENRRSPPPYTNVWPPSSPPAPPHA